MIFLVEDDNSIRELIIYTLNQSGYEAQGFETPSEFWKAIQEQIPELIMLDIMLPQEDDLKGRSKSFPFLYKDKASSPSSSPAS